jgi:hypothetical protein
MKLDSKYFDSIRVAPKRERAEPVREEHPCCQWKGCAAPGRHKAPRGRGRDGQYYLFCLDHVRQYNASYNYFEGMNDAEVEEFQKDAIIGHRPTWKVGVNSSTKADAAGKDARPANGARAFGWRALDPHGFFAWRARAARETPVENRRQLRPLEKKSLQTLNLTGSATRVEIKARFKELVKIHHPDASGDARSGDKLREIIQAYNYLKQAGLA